MKRLLSVSTVIILMLSFLPGCLPSASSVERPTFRPLPESLTLVKLDPPGVGSGTATFRLEVEVGNPNTFALALSNLDFTLFLGGKHAAQGSSSEEVNLPPTGRERLTLNVTVDLDQTPEVLGDMARLVTGEPLPYHLEGAATVEAFGFSRRLDAVTLAEGRVEPPVTLTAPTFRYLSEVSGLRELSLNRAVITVGLELTNPTPFGYMFRAPALTLSLQGRSVAEASLLAQPVPAFSSTSVTLAFELRPATLGATLFEELTGLSSSRGTELELSGDFSLELPAMFTRDFVLEDLPDAVLR